MSAAVTTAAPSIDERTLQELSAAATLAPETCGAESTTRLRGSDDEGCRWVETEETVTAQITLQGLRGMPAQCLAVHLATSRDAEWRGKGVATVTAFGRIVWSCVLRGSIVVDACTADAHDGAQMLPVMHVTVRKAKRPRSGASSSTSCSCSSWGGFIEEVEFNTLM